MLGNPLTAGVGDGVLVGPVVECALFDEAALVGLVEVRVESTVVDLLAVAGAEALLDREPVDGIVAGGIEAGDGRQQIALKARQVGPG